RELNRNYGITIILITHYMDEAAKADRVVVMDDGRIIFDDVPREVFSHVEELKAVGLDVPQVTELAYELKKNGLEIDGHIITEEECIEALIRILQN
ncbi:MAG TPA: energy-coupling factor transporter ATPase, partial [Oscillospiraceae bacterium]|nr:energy-coupling factor transporter ATPase [Oscillospiraceae bacterium]